MADTLAVSPVPSEPSVLAEGPTPPVPAEEPVPPVPVEDPVPPTKIPPSRWKTGEQLEYLLSEWENFKRAQNSKTLGQFWPRVFDHWQRTWAIKPTAKDCVTHGNIQNARLMLLKEKKTV